MSVKTKKKWTEKDVLDVIERSSLGGSTQGENAVFLRHVANLTGYASGISRQKRTIDGLRIEMYPSRGLRLDAFEVKVSRSDLQKEVDTPDKSDTWAAIASSFTVVVPDKKLADGILLPESWGLAEARTGRLRYVTKPDLSEPELSIDVVTAMARAAAYMVKPEYTRGYEEGRKSAEDEAGELQLSYEQRRGLDWFESFEEAAKAYAKSKGKNSTDAYSILRALKDPEVMQLALDHVDVAAERNRIERSAKSAAVQGKQFAAQLRRAADLLDPQEAAPA